MTDQQLPGTDPHRPAPGAVRASRLRALRVTLPLLVGVVVEVAAFLALAELAGVFVALVVVIGASVLGMVLLAREGRRSVRAAVETARAGRAPEGEVAGGVLAVLGCVLLVVPGVVNSVVGLLLLVARPVLARPAWWLLTRRTRRHGVPTGPWDVRPGAADGRDDVVRGEVVDEGDDRR
ncbi:FxsA family protein [Nocardioides zeae]|uniref:FxsA family protein n=1 Tax=Nocardioides imazamoxiresistens TaxID=3231893 RepID=A0ABU3PT23_9ACTN|nr:FxsA family protein [Nocardioides zeae]MDT9592334.1 FxsA family protein [Nocardioides zeae]